MSLDPGRLTRCDRARSFNTVAFAPRRLSAVALALALGMASAAAQASYRDDARVLAFAQELAQRQGQDFASVWGVLRQAQRRDDVIELVKPAPTPQDKNWRAYRQRFVTPQRIQNGVAFWRRNAAALRRAEHQYGVEQPIIVGILGVETIFGQQTGKVPTLDALTTLAFDFPSAHPRAQQRSAFFRDELAALLELSRNQHRAVTQWRGSYAGALGYPQFMPSSWLRWAIDFDGDGRIDLSQSAADAIGSIANYLSEHGWQRSLATHWPTQVSGGDAIALAEALLPDIKPSLSPQALRAAGAQLPDDLPASPPPLALVQLFNGRDAAPTYVLGSTNFYTLTRYNQSSYYALAVIELGQAIAQARAAGRRRR